MRPDLSEFFKPLLARYHRMELLSTDPLEFPHRYRSPYDQEAAAVVSALLAYGNVKQIRKSLGEALRRCEAAGGSLEKFVRRAGADAAFSRRALKGFVHRFNTGDDLGVLFHLLGRSWDSHGSLGAHFLSLQGDSGGKITTGLNGLMLEWASWAKPLKPNPSFFYFLTAPKDGSACKRWCMLLRWMVRKDSLDLGLWGSDGPWGFGERALRPSQLVLPLDTHTGRISQYLRLTRRKSLGWKAALEITDELSLCDPNDPTRYDFALSRLGILDRCQREYRREICEGCELFGACGFAKRNRKKAPENT